MMTCLLFSHINATDVPKQYFQEKKNSMFQNGFNFNLKLKPRLITNHDFNYFKPNIIVNDYGFNFLKEI